MLIVGDEVHPAQEASSLLLVASVQRSPTMRIKSVATAALRNPASALAWLSPSRILVSAGNALIVMKLNDSVLRSRSQLPAFHHDDIRDIQAASPHPHTHARPCRLRRCVGFHRTKASESESDRARPKADRLREGGMEGGREGEREDEAEDGR
jgi:hypothetical protein